MSADLQEAFEAEDLAREHQDTAEEAQLDARITELLEEGRQLTLPHPRGGI